MKLRMKPGIKLTRREKYLLAVLFTAICGYLYFRLVFLPEGARYAALKAEYSRKLAVLDAVNNKEERMKEIDEEIRLLDAEVAHIKDKLVLPLFVPDMLVDLHSQALRNNVIIDNIAFAGAASPVKGELTGMADDKTRAGQLSDIVGSFGSSVSELLSSIDNQAAGRAGTVGSLGSGSTAGGTSQGAPAGNASSGSAGGTADRKAPEALKDLSISFSFTSSYTDLLNFIRYFEEGKRYAVVEVLDIGSSDAGMTGIMSVRLFALKDGEAERK